MFANVCIEMVALKIVHIACAAIWLGNFVVTGLWSIRAFASKRLVLQRFAVSEILFTDAVFTLILGAFVIVTGVLLATRDGVSVWETVWTRRALEIVIAAALLWLVLLLPLELQMRSRLKLQRPVGNLFVVWNVAGWSVTLALFAVIYLMVAKPV